jgi:hypothetical protein
MGFGRVLCLLAAVLLSACSLQQEGKFRLTDAKIVTAVDEKLLPVKITNVFPEGTQKVSCWFQWRNAKVNTPLTASWYYTTDNIHILAYVFNLPRTEGSGSVILSMPEGKELPSGSYSINLAAGKDSLKSLTFKVE